MAGAELARVQAALQAGAPSPPAAPGPAYSRRRLRAAVLTTAHARPGGKAPLACYCILALMEQLRRMPAGLAI
jgi:hypothetical protein